MTWGGVHGSGLISLEVKFEREYISGREAVVMPGRCRVDAKNVWVILTAVDCDQRLRDLWRPDELGFSS